MLDRTSINPPHFSSNSFYFISIPFLFHFYFISISFLFHFYSISIPVLFQFHFISIPFLFHFHFISISFLFHSYFISIPFLFHFYSISIPLLFNFYFMSISFLFHFYFISISFPFLPPYALGSGLRNAEMQFYFPKMRFLKNAHLSEWHLPICSVSDVVLSRMYTCAPSTDQRVGY